ncbi:MAG TPA: dienelactone hydrolase family protein [Verrucomicrobiae bacterium]|nr:dienelactone hydrolase family protein [Verrucomicrobiae bacterium]
MLEPLDPTKATAPAVDRRTFVGFSAGAAIAAAATATTFAQDTLGKTHPPLVAADDPAIVTEDVTLRRPDASVAGYAGWPRRALPNTPALVVIMHIWGVDTSIRDVVRRYAKAGYAAIAPDLYSRFGAPSGDGVSDIDVFRPFAKRLDRTQYDGDIRAAALWLTAKFPQGKVGITGFCMGGTIVLEQAIDNGDLFSAAAPFYGAVKGIDPSKVMMPICGNYGQRDTSIPADEVTAWAKALHVPNDVHEYPEAGHAFFDDQRGAYVPGAAADAWHRTLAFFDKYLGRAS